MTSETERAIQALALVTGFDEKRCDVCAWPLAATIKDGCTLGNCSQRGDQWERNIESAAVWIDAKKALRHLIAEARKVPQWQPWSTAPKDRTEILVACHHGYYVVRYAEDFHGRDIGAWVVDDNKHGPFPLRGTDPTHWMPLPSAPDAETREVIRG